jgi:hypothetical protein
MSDLYQASPDDETSAETVDLDPSDPIDEAEGGEDDESGDEPGNGDDAGEGESGDDEVRPPIEGSVASLLEQAQEEIESLHFDNASLLRDNEALSTKVSSLEESIDSLRDELASTTARELAMGDIFGRLPELRAWSVSEGRETRFILAADMIEAAKTAHETGGAPDRVLLVPKPIIWPSYVAKL